MTESTSNRRKYARVRTESLVSIGRLESSQALAHAVDLSLGGIGFMTVGMGVNGGDVLRVTLTLGQRTAEVLGQVTRVVDHDGFTQELGLSFTKMDAETHDWLAEHLPASVSDLEGRRDYARISYEAIVSVVRASIVDVAAQALDVSLGGLRFEVEGLELQLDDAVRVTLELEGQSVTVVGQLVRVTELDAFSQEVALAFLEVAPDALAILESSLPVGEEI
jgi:hypothetical protein